MAAVWEEIAFPWPNRTGHDHARPRLASTRATRQHDHSETEVPRPRVAVVETESGNETETVECDPAAMNAEVIESVEIMTE